MLKAEPMATRKARIDTFHSTRFTILLVSQTQRYVDKAGHGLNGKIAPAEFLLLAAK